MYLFEEKQLAVASSPPALRESYACATRIMQKPMAADD